VNSIIQTVIVLGTNEERDEKNEDDTSLPININISSINHKEDHEAQILQVVDVGDSIQEQEQQHY
jgi:hypothetical protein